MHPVAMLIRNACQYVNSSQTNFILKNATVALNHTIGIKYMMEKMYECVR